MHPLLRTVWRFLNKLKIELPYDPAIELLDIYPNDTDVEKKRHLYPNVYSSNGHGHKTIKRTKMPFNRQWIRKMWSIYMMEYYASVRKDEYPTFVATWTGLEEIMLSDISQAERVNYHMVSLICGA